MISLRTLIGLFALCLSLLPLAACGPSSAERCRAASDPTECMQVAGAGGDVSDYLTYGMAGYMLSSAINGAGQRQQVIVADPAWHGARRAIPSYQASRERVRRSTVTTTTTTKRNLFGGTTTKTSVSRYSSRPSYSRSSSRSGRR